MNKKEKVILIVLLVTLIIVVFLTMVYMVYTDVTQEKKARELTANEIEMEYITKCALNDIDMPNAEHCLLVEVMHDKAYKQFILVIENEGVYVVGVNYEEGIAKYIDVEKQIY